MRCRSIVLTAAAAVLSTTAVAGTAAAGATPSSWTAQDSTAGRAASFGGTVTNSTTTAPDGMVTSRPPAIHAMTAASGAPRIASRTPALHATGVARTSNIKVRFNKAVRSTSIVIRLRDSVTGSYVSGRLTYASSTRTATFNPTPTLRSAHKYVVVVSGAKDSAAHVMTRISWSFTTRP